MTNIFAFIQAPLRNCKAGETILLSQAVLNSLILLAAAVIIYFRAPALFLEPRFWAEEGALYFSYAFRQPWHKVLFAPHLGYYSLSSNLVALLAARTVDLRYAPLVTTLLALVIQLIPIALFLWSPSELWQGPGRKLAGVFIMIFTLSSGEIWLNSLNSQFFLSLTTFLILVEPGEGLAQRRRWLYRGLLALAGLTGPVSCLLAPLFVLKARQQKGREAVIQALLLSVCLLLQTGIFLRALNQQAVPPSRFELLDFPTLIAIIWTKSLVLPLFGPATATAFANTLSNLGAENRADFTLLGLVLLVAGVAIFSRLSEKLDPLRRTLFLGSYLLLTLASTLLAIGPKSLLLSDWFGQRYYYTPNAILLLLSLATLRWQDLYQPNGSLLQAALLAVALCLGLTYYRPTLQLWLNEDWPSWAQEVTRWQTNPSYPLNTWPPGWQVRLTAGEARYHDAETTDEAGIPHYREGVLPWLDLLVRLEDDRWYGPARAADGLQLFPLPQGYHWETRGGFSSLPNGEAWWNKTSPKGEAILYGPDNTELQRLQLKVEIQP